MVNDPIRAYRTLIGCIDMIIKCNKPVTQ